MQQRVSEPFASQESILATLTLSQLFAISISSSSDHGEDNDGDTDWSDYQKERATEILDITLKDLHGE